MTIRNLEALLEPDSVALIGASSRPGSIGQTVARNLLAGPFRDKVQLVNPKRSEIDGLIVGPTTSYERAAEVYGINPRWGGQGDAGQAMVTACMAIKSGLAEVVALVYGNDQRSAKVQYDLARKYGFIDQLMSVRAAGVPVLELEDAHSGAADKVKAETLKAIEEDGAECVLLGCAGMVDLAQRLTQETGIPVMDGVTVAVKMVEALAGLGLGTSKIVSYAPPREKPYTGVFAANAPGPVRKKAAE